MNKTDIELRKVYLRMKKLGSSAVEIAAATGVKIRNVYNWDKLSEEELLVEPNKSTRKPTFDIEALKQYITDNPFAFNIEIGKVFRKHKNTIQYWRSKLGFKRKKAKTTYREADDELKKTLKSRLKQKKKK
jgi:Transposase